MLHRALQVEATGILGLPPRTIAHAPLLVSSYPISCILAVPKSAYLLALDELHAI